MNDFFDFNTARSPIDSENPVTVAEIRESLLDRLNAVLGYLLPGGEYRKDRFVVGNIRGDAGDSLSIETQGPKKGMWHDFATGEGGDILDLWAGATGKNTQYDFPEVLEEAWSWLGGSHNVVYNRIAAKPKKEPENLGPHTAKYDYTDADGNLIACVYRYDTPKGKEFRPWDVASRRQRAPDSRPLYNQVELFASSEVVLVEGEKCADYLISANIVATTAMNGAKAPIDKTDWTPFKQKKVTIWPDNDEAGKSYAEQAAQAIISAGAVAVDILSIPPEMPEKWDAADCDDPESFLQSAERKTISKQSGKLSIFDWKADRFAGKAPDQKFLVEGVFPLGSPAIIAAMGDSGKGMLTLKLALSVATGSPDKIQLGKMAFGGEVKEFGTAVIFTAEDSYSEIHRRIERLDPNRVSLNHKDKLIVVPLPDAGGPFPLVQTDRTGPKASQQYFDIRNQLMQISDLKLVVFDPLSSFIHADVSSDPAAGSFATGLLAELATSTGAAVLIAHHMRKPSGQKPMESPEDARDGVRGSSALVDGVRSVYCLWPEPDEKKQREFLNVFERKFERNQVYRGAVVKSNGPADRTVRHYLRNQTGLLIDVTDEYKSRSKSRYSSKTLTLLVEEIAQKARDGHPYTRTGRNGLFSRRASMAEPLNKVSKHEFEEACGELLEQQRLVLCVASGSKDHKWLDVPEGPFAMGIGEFVTGADT